ncbi:MAG TPA: glycosyltransferase family 4 protein [Rhizomicrobium sp.]
MQSAGASVTILYYATEGMGASEARRMRDVWGDLEVVFPRGFVPKQSLARYPAIDDWYDDAISQAVKRLSAQRRFDVCFVNYVWYSKLFEALPPAIVRVVDTHDLFGGRAERFADIELAPEWFHTSVPQESIGLDRSDFVIAIQSGEAESLKGRTKARVKTVGFLSAADFLPAPDLTSGGRLKAGYIGSGNPFNVSSLLSFARAVQNVARSMETIEFHVAGQICAALSRAPHPFILHGKTENVRDFYRGVDIAINPMVGGTGLKIKSIEALSFGKPLAATRDAMTGIASEHPGHQLDTPEDVVRWLMQIAAQPARIAEEAACARRVFRAYRRAQITAFSELWSEIRLETEARRRSYSSGQARMSAP